MLETEVEPLQKAILEIALVLAQIRSDQAPWTTDEARDWFGKVSATLNAPVGSESGTGTTCESTGREKGEDENAEVAPSS